MCSAGFRGHPLYDGVFGSCCILRILPVPVAAGYVGAVLPPIAEQDEKAYAEEKLKPSMVTEAVKQVAAQAAEGEADAGDAGAKQNDGEDC
eukprot:CAMPEP_0204357926 /NCGR_PEP_ID=MMETSP0469-20131031/36146_1 /ASSEMBLY_ACC=CAM_ASM_000384 /TAXON_ID=2969 /ORGANISM="Oxyrrhis marina" /LENGTH=90 /DNA_ID=CAMNT_0051345707 /DNA_START=56 /DNA_END=329 /DNA_ORIENTATION=-